MKKDPKNDINNGATTMTTMTMTTPTTAKDDKQQDNNNENKQPSKPNETIQYEFNGPIGALGIIVILPIVVLLLLRWSQIGCVDWNFMNPNNTDHISSSNAIMKLFINSHHIACPNCIDNPMVLVYCFCGIVGWFLYLVILERLLPCDIIEGNYIQNDINNGKLQYRINGHLTLWITLLLLYIGYPVYHSDISLWQLHPYPIEYIYEYLEELAFCTIVLSFLLNTYLYVNSFRWKDVIVAKGGNTGNVIYDYFIGRELNPRFGTTTFDWKEFCELRPGMIGWILINISCCKVQYDHLGYNTYSMYIILFFQSLYVWDALYNEKSILTTMDITTDGFGFMLVFGDLVWVPYTYSLQARYLVYHDPHLSIYQVTVIILLFSLGYYIFRSANSEKDKFRTNPNDPKVRHLQYMSTKRGTKLLISGWWGMARKVNYSGDYIIGLCWCLLCGFDSIVPYYYAIYFAILLYHRSLRDDMMCLDKYGDDWITYKKKVPYKFVPGII